MVHMEDYGQFETAWCPGCGNHAILKAVKQALTNLGLAPHQVVFTTGIGQAAKAPLYLRSHMFTGLHGRGLCAATGVKLANPDLVVINESGDGCNYGEGGNHFLAAIRRNVDVTLLAHDNQVYGLTKGQASPTTAQGMKTKAQPYGQPSMAFNPVAVAVAMQAGFVARAFSGDGEHLVQVIMQAVSHKGFSVVDILQPCVSFNKVNTFAWYKERVYRLGPEHDPGDWSQAMQKAREFGERIPLGVIWRSDRPAFEAGAPGLAKGPLAVRRPDKAILRRILMDYA